jgi:hypothetical protein
MASNPTFAWAAEVDWKIKLDSISLHEIDAVSWCYQNGAIPSSTWNSKTRAWDQGPLDRVKIVPVEIKEVEDDR